MLVPNQKVKVKITTKNRQHYINKGYALNEETKELIVDAEDLTHGSHSVVEVKCDYCGKILYKKFQTYIAQHDEEFGDACADCQPQKNKLVCLRKYGVDNGSKTKDAINKIKSTSLARYGVENPAQSEQARAKIKKSSKANAQERLAKARITNLERYGCEYPPQNKEVMDKQRNTMIARYGVPHPKQCEEIKQREREHNREKYGCDYYWQTNEGKEKIRKTNIEKYGVENPAASDEIRAKINQTLLENGTVKTSSQQIELKEMLDMMYGECKLNYPCGKCFLDCAINIKGCLIDVEYDGRYWHQDEQRDRRRDEFVKSWGYKVLRIRANYSIPTEEQLTEAIDYLLKEGNDFTTIELDI